MTTTHSTTSAASSTLPLGLSRAARHADDQPISELIRIAFRTPGIISLAAGLVDYDTLPGEEVTPIIRDQPFIFFFISRRLSLRSPWA